MDNVKINFNNTLNEFLQKMINQFTDEPKLKKYYQAFKMCNMYDNSLPLKLFMGGCLNYRQEIKTKNEDFFKQKPGFKEYCTGLSSFASDSGLIERWDDLSPSSKNAIWEYIQTLYVMGEMYINKDTTILTEISKIKNNFTREEVDNMYNNNNISDAFKNKLIN
jgi:hypothetical protein